MSDSRFGKAKTDGAIVPGSSQKPDLRRTKTVERFFAAVREEDESRQYDALMKKMPIIDETQELRTIVPKEELHARVQLLGDLLTGQRKQSDLEVSDANASLAAAAAKI